MNLEFLKKCKILLKVSIIFLLQFNRSSKHNLEQNYFFCKLLIDIYHFYQYVQLFLEEFLQKTLKVHSLIQY